MYSFGNRLPLVLLKGEKTNKPNFPLDCLSPVCKFLINMKLKVRIITLLETGTLKCKQLIQNTCILNF